LAALHPQTGAAGAGAGTLIDGHSREHAVDCGGQAEAPDAAAASPSAAAAAAAAPAAAAAAACTGRVSARSSSFGSSCDDGEEEDRDTYEANAQPTCVTSLENLSAIEVSA
jgi:hypothetical protein